MGEASGRVGWRLGAWGGLGGGGASQEDGNGGFWGEGSREGVEAGAGPGLFLNYPGRGSRLADDGRSRGGRGT